MRVIAGLYRGRKLEAPPGLTTRPITDRVKETLFNILGHRFGQPGALPAIDVLDVFAGTGGLGIEALSRGAQTCMFVERDRRALRCLRDNLDKLRLTATCPILADNAWTMRPPAVAGGFSLMFIDPPYRESEDALQVVDLLERLAPSLAPDGVAVHRHEAQALFPANQLRALQVVDERSYGRMRLVFLARVVGAGVPTESP